MTELISPSLRHKINKHKQKGGKKSRQAEGQRIERFIKWCRCPAPEIGRKHVHIFFEEKRFSPSTNRDYFYAISKLWKMLGRAGGPPRPPDHSSPG